MAFGARGKKPGGKRGMRQNNGKRGATGHTLRPAPAPDASTSRRAVSSSPERPWLDDQEEEDDDQLDYLKALNREVKPLEGFTVTVSGCGKDKSGFMDLADQLGAKSQPALTNETTHLIADKHGSAKFDMAIKKRMKIMSPSWLPAVREAWTSAAKVDFAEIEEEHRFKPLSGTSICFTCFNNDEYRTSLISAIRAAGGEYSSTLRSSVTHLVVASPTRGHRQPNPNLEKITHALHHGGRALPYVTIVWEGWLSEVLKLGGRLSEREPVAGRKGSGVWEWREGGVEPVELPEFVVEREEESEEASACGRGKGKGKLRELGVQDTLVAAGESGRKRASVVLGAEGEEEEELQVARKRARPSAQSRGAIGADVDDLLQDFGSQLRVVAQHTALPPLPPLPSSASRPPLAARPRAEPAQHQELAMEVDPNADMPFQLGKKGKSVIKALSTSRSGSFSLNSHPTDAKRGGGAKALALGKKKVVTDERFNDTTGDDSGFLEELEAFVDTAPPSDLPPLHSTAAPGMAILPPAPQPSSGSSGEEPDLPIFEGVTFALMGMKEGNRESVVRGVESRGGRCLIDDEARDVEGKVVGDWICVEYFGAPTEFLTSSDPRIVTGCWIEYCIMSDAIVEVQDRLLERPMAYSVPVAGAEKLLVHMTTFEGVEAVHLRRFITDIGGTVSQQFHPRCTHLIHGDVTSFSGELEEGQQLEGVKAEKAQEWGVPIKGVQWLRHWAREKGEEADRRRELEMEEDSTPRDITNEGGRRSRSKTAVSAEEENLPLVKREGPLSSCTILFSSKIPRADHASFVDKLTSLGASHAKSFSASVTHLLHAGTKQNETFGDFKKARAAKLPIVHPEWLEKCYIASDFLNEGDFPHTLDPRKGGQLAGLVASPPRKDSSASQSTSRGASRSGSQSMSRKSSKQKQGIVPPRLNSRAFDEMLEQRMEEQREAPVQVEQDDSALMEVEDLGGMDPLDQRFDETDLDAGAYEEEARDPSPSPSPKKAQSQPPLSRLPQPQSPPRQSQAMFTSSPGPSSPPPQARPRPPTHLTSDPADQSSDPVAPLPPRVEEPTRLLKEQTSLLLAQLDAAVPVGQAKGGMASRIARKKSDPTDNSLLGANDRSLSASRSAPSLLPDLANRHQPRRIPGYGPSQYTQGGAYGDEEEEESMYVTYDDPQEREAREQIQSLLAGGGAGGAAAEEEAPRDTQGSVRKKRKREREIRQDVEEAEGVETQVRRSARKAS